MRRDLALVCLAAALAMACAGSERNEARARMEVRIRVAARSEGTVSLYAKNLDSGASFGLREDERVRTASTIKLPILVAVYAAVEDGRAKWHEQVPLNESDKASGSGVLREFSEGTQLRLQDLARLMIVVSDNTATNLLLDRFSAEVVNREMDRLGLKQTRSLRKVLGSGGKPGGFSEAGKKEENQRYGLGVSTPREMVELLEKLERGEVVSAAASKEMIEILKRQQYKHGIGRRVKGMTVASKSGALDRLRSDVGIVYSPGGRVAMAITVDDLAETDYSPENAGEKLIGELAMILTEGLGNQQGRRVTGQREE